jgi:tRNA(fMet)-specific endonuclease VapC
MSGREIALDTSAVIALLAGNPAVRRAYDEADVAYVSFAARGELLHGALKSARVDENLSRVRAFVDSCGILPYDPEVEWRYAEIKTALRRAGRPVPDNDIWIAACALASDLPLVHLDAHFDEIERALSVLH